MGRVGTETFFGTINKTNIESPRMISKYMRLYKDLDTK